MNFRITFAITLLLLWPLSAGAVEVKRVVSPGGIEAWLVEDHSNPIISLDLAFRAIWTPRAFKGSSTTSRSVSVSTPAWINSAGPCVP
jgi:hypothetical protein